MSQIQYRQGDVLLELVDVQLPCDAQRVKRDRGRVVLAYGEVTGHAHAITDAGAELFQRLVEDGMEERFLRVESEVALEHEEHGTITIPPGLYRQVPQNEYTPAEIRRVAD